MNASPGATAATGQKDYPGRDSRGIVHGLSLVYISKNLSMNKLIFGYSVPDQDDEEWEVDEAEWVQAGENIWNVRFEMKRERERQTDRERMADIKTTIPCH